MKQRSDDEIIAYLRTHSHLWNSKVANNLNMAGPGASARIQALREKAGLTQSVRPSVSRRHRSKVGLTRESFLAKFDQDTRLRESIRTGVKTLTNVDEILQEAEFRSERCPSAHSGRFASIAEEREFKQYRFQAGGKIHWAHPETKKWAIENVEGARDV